MLGSFHMEIKAVMLPSCLELKGKGRVNIYTICTPMSCLSIVFFSTDNRLKWVVIGDENFLFDLVTVLK